MESTVHVRHGSWRLHITLGFFGTLLLLGLSLIFASEVSFILLAFGWVVVVIGVIVGVAKIVRLIYWIKHKRIDLDIQRQFLRLETYKADRAQAERFVLAFPRTQRILLPADADVRLIEAWADGGSAAGEPEESAEIELATAFMQPGQAYAIIGGQQTGKTFQARHLAALWLARNITPTVIGPKWDRGEWGGCRLMGGYGDYAAVAAGIDQVRQAATVRHADSERGHKSHPLQPVFFDDWTAIVENCDNARLLIFEATTLYASVNIVLYFIIHADTAAAWGVDRKGAALKDNFIKLFILPQYDAGGRVIRERTRGLVRLASGEERPAVLFAGPVAAAGAPEIIDVTPAGPSAEERRVLALWQAGEHSYRAITGAVWGQHGDFYNRKVDEILRRWGEL